MVEEKKFYLTKQGLERMENEHKELKNLKLAKTKGEIPKVLHSEEINLEYLSFQEDLDFLESRIVELENILKRVKLIKIPPKNKQNIVNLGATILVDTNGQEAEFELVGSLEADPSVGRISNESPVGKMLLGHKVSDVVNVSSTMKTTYRIKKIKYKTV